MAMMANSTAGQQVQAGHPLGQFEGIWVKPGTRSHVGAQGIRKIMPVGRPMNAFRNPCLRPMDRQATKAVATVPTDAASVGVKKRHNSADHHQEDQLTGRCGDGRSVGPNWPFAGQRRLGLKLGDQRITTICRRRHDARDEGGHEQLGVFCSVRIA